MAEPPTPEGESLADRTAIVTGGAGGIGTSVSIRLAKDGANVVIAQRSRDRAETVTDRIEALGRDARFVETDLAEDDDIEALVEETVDEFGALSIVVNTATHPDKEPAAEMGRELWDDILSVTLSAPFRLAQEAYPHMRDAGYGRIISIGAIQAHSPLHGAVGYAAAKSGLEGLTRALATEWSDTTEADITANMIHVGATPNGYDWEEHDEPLEVANDLVSQEKDTGHPRTLVGRTGRPSDHAALVAYLASPESAFMTGEVLTLDGGRLMSRYGDGYG